MRRGAGGRHADDEGDEDDDEDDEDHQDGDDEGDVGVFGEPGVFGRRFGDELEGGRAGTRFGVRGRRSCWFAM